MEIKKMQVSLSQEQEQFIQQELRKGHYKNAEEIVGVALHLLKERLSSADERRLEELRQKIASGTAQIARGQVTHGEIVFDRLQEKIRSISQE